MLFESSRATHSRVARPRVIIGSCAPASSEPAAHRPDPEPSDHCRPPGPVLVPSLLCSRTLGQNRHCISWTLGVTCQVTAGLAFRAPGELVVGLERFERSLLGPPPRAKAASALPILAADDDPPTWEGLELDDAATGQGPVAEAMLLQSRALAQLVSQSPRTPTPSPSLDLKPLRSRLVGPAPASACKPSPLSGRVTLPPG